MGCFTELGSDEESGKDWSDLEREAEEEDNQKQHDAMTGGSNTKVGGGNRSSHQR